MVHRFSVALVAAMGLALSAGMSLAADYKAPRTAAGQPDLQGVWTNVSLTGLERPANFKGLVVSEAEAKDLEARRALARAAQDRPTDPNAPAPRAGADVGGYNGAYIDSGIALARIKGQVRSSWIVDPADGKLPYSPAGRRMLDTSLAKARTTFDGPEARPLGERCILGYGSTAGPPMLNVLYNNNYQIVQTPETVMVLVEMNHDARVIRLGGTHPPANVRPWMGDSIGHWEGETLVVETTNFNPGESLRPYFAQTIYISPDAKVTERFTRVADGQILYDFTVDDPATFTRPWRAEMALNATRAPIYEYACHEGNYSLPGILRGARLAEKEGRPVEEAGLGE